MAIYALYRQDFEGLSTATENPDGWTSNRSIAPTVTYLPAQAPSGVKSLGANLENDAPAGTQTVLLSKTLTTVNGRSYTIKARYFNRVSGTSTNIRVGAGTSYGTGLTAAQGVTVNPTYTFTASSTSTTIRLSVDNTDNVGTLGLWDIVLVQWSDATANTVAAPNPSMIPSDLLPGASLPFQWSFQDPQLGTGDRQSAFQILLTKDGTQVWDSGKRAYFSESYTMDNSEYYADLGSYSWRVRTWDLSDSASAYSTASTFTINHVFQVPETPIITSWETTRASNAPLYMTFQYRSGDPGFNDPMSQAYLQIRDPTAPLGVYAYSATWLASGGGTLNLTSLGGDNYAITVPANLLTVGKTYNVQLDTTDTYPGGGQSATTTLTVIAPPNAPTLNSHGMFYAHEPATFTWNYNASATSGGQQAYEVYTKIAGGTEVLQASVSGSATSYTLPANTLTAGYEYTWRVVTYGLGGGSATSTWGTVNLAYQNDNPTVTLNPITFFNATAAKTISWVYNGNDVNDPQSKYQVVIKEGSTVVHDSGSVTSAATSYNIPANTLQNNKTYTVTVTVTDTRWNESVIQIGRDILHPAEAINIGDYEAAGYWTNSLGTVVPSTTYPRTGSTALYQSGNFTQNSSYHQFSRSALGLVPGASYTLTGYAAHNRAVNNRESQSSFFVNQTGISGVVSTPYTHASNAAVGQQTYQPVTYKFTPGSDDVIYIYLQMATLGGGSSNSRTYWDDIALSRDAWTETVPTIYNTTPATGSASLTFKTNYTPSSPTVVHRTDFIAQNTAILDWNFVDPNTDQADAQTAYQVVITRTSDSVVVHDTGKVTSTATQYTLPAATLANGVTYRWQVYTWDSFNVQSPPSAPDTFNTAADVTITITSPVDGVVLDTNQVAVNWSVAIFGADTQSHRQIKVYRTDTGALVTDTGLVASTSTSYTATGLLSDILYRIEVQIRSSAGVYSNVAQVTVFPDYVNPNEPTATLSTIGAQVTVVVTNPAATGLRPDVVTNEIWRAPNIGLSAGQFVKIGEASPNGSFTDYLVGANSTYLYYVKAVS